jgi:hypothetical protein
MVAIWDNSPNVKWLNGGYPLRNQQYVPIVFIILDRYVSLVKITILKILFLAIFCKIIKLYKT